MALKVVAIKIPESMLAEVDATVSRFVYTRREALITRNAFIERAIAHELAHLKRSRSRRSVRTDLKADCGGVGITGSSCVAVGGEAVAV
jgi:metal-responsive CopG/Arc/MetJ family transcriptional regulator